MFVGSGVVSVSASGCVWCFVDFTMGRKAPEKGDVPRGLWPFLRSSVALLHRSAADISQLRSQVARALSNILCPARCSVSPRFACSLVETSPMPK